jgi:uncharacterized membrane protein HdeD (DUF308 family)
MTASAMTRPQFPRLLRSNFRRPALVVGLSMLGLAAAAAAYPREAPLVLGATAGWLLWLAGALMLGFSLLTFTSWLRLAGALAALVAVGCGMYLTFNPTVGALAALLLLGAAFIVDGGFQVAAALHLRPLGVWRWMMASAITSLLAGAVLTINHVAPGELVAWLVCAVLGSTGLALFALSLSRRSSFA